MYLDSRNHIDWYLIFRGVYGDDLTKLFERIISTGGTVIDVCANNGAYTITFAAAAGPLGSVLAFEPNPSIRSQLQKNVALNDFVNVKVFECALGNVASTLSLKVPSSNSAEYSNMGLASFVALETPHELVAVGVRLLDDVINDVALTRIDMIKVDVQGYELFVLDGARKTLEKFRPAIVFEWDAWSSDCAGTSLLDIKELLELLGYGVYEFDQARQCLVQISDTANVANDSGLIAVHDGKKSNFPLPFYS